MARPKQYLNNESLLEEIYLSIERNELTPKCVDLLMKLAQRVQRKLYYSCEDDKSQCLSETYYELCKRWTKFNPFLIRVTGFELVKPEDQFKFYLNESRDSIQKCTAIGYAEIYKEDKYYTLQELKVDITSCKEFYPYELHLSDSAIKNLPSILTILNNLLGEYDRSLSRIKVKYEKDGEEIETYVSIDNAIIKDPNPFSYFTSVCINGYAKGYKELNPPKAKGCLISLDSGFNQEDSIDLFNF